MTTRDTGSKSPACIDPACRLISRMDRIVIRLHQYGIASSDIAMIVNSTEDRIEAWIRRIKKSLEEMDSETVTGTEDDAGKRRRTGRLRDRAYVS